MNKTAQPKSLCWTPDQLPPNVRLGANSVIIGHYLPGDHPFKRFRSRLDPAIVVGAGSTMNGVYFNMGHEARINIAVARKVSRILSEMTRIEHREAVSRCKDND